MAESLLKKVVFPPSGKYILAVSGGVDSVVLLDMMAQASKKQKYQLVVAHFDHGMRTGSKADRQLVEELAKKYGLKFEFKAVRLGPASEARARSARYAWLNQVKTKYGANKIITAHHFDDALETAIFNAGRGADFLGLTPLHLNQQVLRPLLNIPKAQLISYAKTHRLSWHEDPSNAELQITRNLIRQLVAPKLTAAQINEFKKLVSLNSKISAQLDQFFIDKAKLKPNSISIPRSELASLSTQVVLIILRAALNRLNISVEAKQLNQLWLKSKTAAPPSQYMLSAKLRVQIGDDMITLVKLRGRSSSSAKLSTSRL